MIAPSIQPQLLHVSPFCSSNYNKSATIQIQRHHPHQHHSKAATRRRKQHEHHNHRSSFRYTRTTLDIIPEDIDQQQDTDTDASTRCCGEENNAIQTATSESQPQQHHSVTTSGNSVIATDFWHSTRSLKKSANFVSLDSLAAIADSNSNSNEIMEARNDKNDDHQVSNMAVSLGQIHIHYGGGGGQDVFFGDDYDNFLEDWEL